MSDNKKPSFDLEDFPFDKLRLGGNDEKGYKPNDFGSAHQFSFLELEPGVYSEYTIKRPSMLSQSITYWLPEKGDQNKPHLYHHVPLYPKWHEKNSKGEVSKMTNPTGKRVEAFLVKLQNAITRELQKLNEDDRIAIMGYKVANQTDWVDPIAPHPVYEKGHKFANRPNTDKSPSWPITVWTQDVGKPKEDDKDKKKKKKGSDTIIKIPGTNTIIHCPFFWVPPGSKSKSDWDPLDDYSKIKKYIYRSDPHPNASPAIADILSSGTILGFSILWKPGTSELGKVQFKECDLAISICNIRSYSRSLTEDRVNKMNEDCANAMEEFGIVQQEEAPINDFGKTPANAAGILPPTTNDNAPRKKIEFRSGGGGANSTDSGEISEPGSPTDDPSKDCPEDLILENDRIAMECFDQ
jgi:hypothetical protein